MVEEDQARRQFRRRPPALSLKVRVSPLYHQIQLLIQLRPGTRNTPTAVAGAASLAAFFGPSLLAGIKQPRQSPFARKRLAPSFRPRRFVKSRPVRDAAERMDTFGEVCRSRHPSHVRRAQLGGRVSSGDLRCASA
jgi:hypothetical protein